MNKSGLPARRAILVFGMHRSGTSAVSRTLNLLGAKIGARLVGAIDGNNRLGFWENADAVDINDQWLRDLGRSWYDMRRLPKDWMEVSASREAIENIRHFIRNEFSDTALCAIKDPRLCLFASAWLQAIAAEGQHAGIVLVVRHPVEVVASLYARDGLSKGHACVLWGRYMASALRATVGLPVAVVDYARFLQDWREAIAGIGSALRLRWPIEPDVASSEIESYLDRNERHHVMPPEEAVSRDPLTLSVEGIYKALLLHGPDAVQTQDAIARFETAADIVQEPLRDLFDHVQVHVHKAERIALSLSSEVEDAHAARMAAATSTQRLHDLQAELTAQLIAEQKRSYDLETQRALLEVQIADLRGYIANRDAELASLQASLKTHEAELSNLRASHGWRLTAPLRALRSQLAVSVWCGRAGRGVRRLYEALPMSTPARLRLKDQVFRLFSPLLRRTTSYRAWQAFKAHREQPEDASVVAVRTDFKQSAASAGDSSPASRMLEGLYTAAASDYVAWDNQPAGPAQIDVRAIAFYLPQFHPIPENDEWWGRGFTEWTNVSKAMPQFVGHYQPRLPGELGFYDLRVADVMRRQVELAKHYGLQGFCFHYYWFAGRRLLERPLQQFFENKDIDFPFCICWANENWTRRWDGMDQEVLVAQHYSPEDDIAFITALEPLLRDPRYIHVDSKPLIVLYRPSILPDAAVTLRRWREHCRKVGVGEIFLAMVQFDVEDPRIYGFDTAIEFPPHKLAKGLAPINDQLQIVNPKYSGYVIDYQSVIERARQHEAVGFNMIRGVFPSWDNEARKPAQGYTFANATPERYREWLAMAADYARQHPVAGERLIFINAWNEWAEGAYLEPDRRYGYAYLQATREALTRGPVTSGRLVIVSHDAHPHGAQYLALHLAREYAGQFGLAVDVVLLGPGGLRAEFAHCATVHDLSGFDPRGPQALELAQRLHSAGARHAIANTTISGLFAATLRRVGFTVIGLVHELPGVIREFGLKSHARALAASADRLVFPAAQVRDGFASFATLRDEQASIQPQGLYKLNRYASADARGQARNVLRKRLGIAQDVRIVLSVGYADQRKGIDLFVDAGVRLMRIRPDVHFLWVGHFDLALEPQVRATIDAAGMSARFHFPGIDPDTDLYYADADVYALTSREDPFPSVVLEALQVGVPVVGFEGAGGFASLLDRGAGLLVPAFDTGAFAVALRSLLDDPARARSMGACGQALIEEQCSFRSYLFDLLDMLGLKLPRVSVIVPNYNYARYLPERIGSITRQYFPFYELLVLDDASTDDSVQVIERLAVELRVHLRIVRNERNSGSVFEQWAKGVAMARGDLVWIAEADDLAEPSFLGSVLTPMADPTVVMGYCQSQQIDTDGRQLAESYLDYTKDVSEERWLQPYRVEGLNEIRTCMAIKNTIPNVSAVVFRRTALVDAFDRVLAELRTYRIAGDWLTYLAVLERGDVVFVPKPLNLHRRHASSVTIGSDQRPHMLEVLRVQRLVQQRYSPPAESVRKASEYAHQLYRYFKLSDVEIEEIEALLAKDASLQIQYAVAQS